MSDTNNSSVAIEDPGFLGNEYEAIDHVVALETKKEPLHFEPITMEEMTVAQHNDTFCTDIARRLNEGVVLPFSHD